MSGCVRLLDWKKGRQLQQLRPTGVVINVYVDVVGDFYGANCWCLPLLSLRLWW